VGGERPPPEEGSTKQSTGEGLTLRGRGKLPAIGRRKTPVMITPRTEREERES